MPELVDRRTVLRAGAATTATTAVAGSLLAGAAVPADAATTYRAFWEGLVGSTFLSGSGSNKVTYVLESVVDASTDPGPLTSAARARWHNQNFELHFHSDRPLPQGTYPLRSLVTGKGYALLLVPRSTGDQSTVAVINRFEG